MAWYHRAKVGDKVVFVKGNDTFYLWPRGVRFPSHGCTYTIRAIEPHRDGQCIALVEIINPPQAFIEGFREPYFGVEGFCPVQSLSTEKRVVELKKLLNSSSVKGSKPV